MLSCKVGVRPSRCIVTSPEQYVLGARALALCRQHTYWGFESLQKQLSKEAKSYMSTGTCLQEEKPTECRVDSLAYFHHFALLFSIFVLLLPHSTSIFLQPCMPHATAWMYPSSASADFDTDPLDCFLDFVDVCAGGQLQRECAVPIAEAK